MSNTSGKLFSLMGIFVSKELLNRWWVGGGAEVSDVFVWVFVKGHALIHSRKWVGHDFFRQKFLKK